MCIVCLVCLVYIVCIVCMCDVTHARKSPVSIVMTLGYSFRFSAMSVFNDAKLRSVYTSVTCMIVSCACCVDIDRHSHRSETKKHSSVIEESKINLHVTLFVIQHLIGAHDSIRGAWCSSSTVNLELTPT